MPSFRNGSRSTLRAAIDIALLQDEEISYEARGLCAYLLSKPPTWKGLPGDLMRRGRIGRDQCRRIVKELEEAGYLAFRKEHVNGKLDQWYDAFETALPPDQRTKSWLNNKDGSASAGAIITANGFPGSSFPASSEPASSFPGGLDNRELRGIEKEETKEEREEAPSLLSFLIKKFGTDPLSGRKDQLKEPAIRVTVAFHQTKSPNTKPTDSRFFLPDLDTFANAMGYHGLQHERRVLDEIALEARDRNELPFDLLKRLGLGPAPKGPHPSWDEKLNAMTERGMKAVKARLMKLDDRPQELVTGDGQKYRRTAADCVAVALGALPDLPKEARKAIWTAITADTGFMYDYQVSMAAQLAREKLLNTKEKLTLADAINSLDWYDVRVLHAAMTTLTTDPAFQTELEERRKVRKWPKPREPFREGTPDPRPAFQKGTVR